MRYSLWNDYKIGEFERQSNQTNSFISNKNVTSSHPGTILLVATVARFAPATKLVLVASWTCTVSFPAYSYWFEILLLETIARFASSKDNVATTSRN